MANFKVLEEAYVRDSSVLYQGKVEFEGEEVMYRYYEDNNGADTFVWTESEGWAKDHPFIPVLWATVSEWGSPVEFGQPGEVCDIEDELVEDWM